MDYKDTPEKKSSWKLRRRKEFRTKGVLALRLPAVLFGCLLALSYKPNFLNLPGAWENLILSDWIQPYARYPELLKIGLNRGFKEPEDLWRKPENPGWTSCVLPSDDFQKAEATEEEEEEAEEGFLQVWLEGGLNQQRIGVCNAVALARLLNVTLLLPELEKNPVWQDDSTFGEIFDVDHLINSLKDDIKIVKSLPDELSWSTREFYRMPAHGAHTHVHTRIKNAPNHATADWYIENVLPVIQNYRIAAIAPFTHRLAFNGLPPDIQKLRCRVNFHYLRFVPTIETLANSILDRLRSTQLELPGLAPNHPLKRWAFELGKSSNQEKSTSDPEVDMAQPEPSKFVALHLRFDKDMVAHSSCEYGGGYAERRAMAKYRHFAWQNRIDKLQYSPEELRKLGKCPLTPEEIGLMLAALGFSNRTRLYVATYKVYGGEERMAPLRRLFPLTVDKTMLATPQELQPFQRKASHFAAIDFIVSYRSDVFLSASPGNMRNVLAGFRQYHGVLKTINPSLTKLALAFSNSSMTWEDFKRVVRQNHKKRVGQVIPRAANQSVYTYPAPDCMCFEEQVENKS